VPNEYQAKSHAKSDQSLDSASTVDRAGDETKNSDLQTCPAKTNQTEPHCRQPSPPNPVDTLNQKETVSEGPRKQLLFSDMPKKFQEAWDDIHNWPRIEDTTQ
jgi:hypothetical protein